MLREYEALFFNRIVATLKVAAYYKYKYLVLGAWGCGAFGNDAKTVSDLYLPISGKVIEFNEELESEPELVNTDPYGKGWIIKLKIANDADQSELLSAEQYQEVIG